MVTSTRTFWALKSLIVVSVCSPERSYPKFRVPADNTANDGRRLTLLCYLNPNWWVCWEQRQGKWGAVGSYFEGHAARLSMNPSIQAMRAFLQGGDDHDCMRVHTLTHTHTHHCCGPTCTSPTHPCVPSGRRAMAALCASHRPTAASKWMCTPRRVQLACPAPMCFTSQGIVDRAWQQAGLDLSLKHAQCAQLSRLQAGRSQLSVHCADAQARTRAHTRTPKHTHARAGRTAGPLHVQGGRPRGSAHAGAAPLLHPVVLWWVAWAGEQAGSRVVWGTLSHMGR